MKKEIRLKRINQILKIVIVLLVLVLLIYGIKCIIETNRMKAELEAAEQEVSLQEEENREVNHFVENGDYYLEQQARGEGEYSDPEEDVYVVVP